MKNETTLQAAMTTLNTDTDLLLAYDGGSLQIQGTIKTDCESVIDSATDAGHLSSALLTYVNDKFSRELCKGKGNPFTKRFNTVKKTLQDAGKRDHLAIQFDIGFNVSGDNRTVTVTTTTEAQRAVADKRNVADKARADERADEDKVMEHAAHVEQQLKLSDGDVAAKMAEYFAATFGETHLASDVSMVWATVENQDDSQQQAA